MNKRILIVASFIIFLAIPFSAFGSTSFENIVAFGDSLTDNGKYPTERNTYLNDVHGFGYFTDGAVWVETLTSTMGSSTLYDHAYGGATTSYDNPKAFGSLIYGLQWQLENAYPSVGGNDTLFTVWAGANDFFQVRDFSLAATNIVTALGKLKENGAQNILVPNLPDLGMTPGFYNNTDPNVTTAQASAWTQGFNNQLHSGLQAFAGENSSMNIYFLDVYALFSDLLLMDNGEINPVYLSSLFYDDFHPNSIGHTILAAEAYNVLQSGPMSAPIPGAVWLLGSGFLGFAGLRRKQKK
ncbi:MAG: hypothetical protein KKC46_11260 [Proteobacteria bacterium]|nr:hypothetical protein [Pseudomonadota bacterium]